MPEHGGEQPWASWWARCLPEASVAALATLWLGVTDDDHQRRDVAELLAAMLRRPNQEDVLIQS